MSTPLPPPDAGDARDRRLVPPRFFVRDRWFPLRQAYAVGLLAVHVIASAIGSVASALFSRRDRPPLP